MPVQRPETSELAYTTRKIEANFSNFSAWHQRSKVFLSLWDSGQLDPVTSKEQGEAFFVSHANFQGELWRLQLDFKNLSSFKMRCTRTQMTKVFGYIIDGSSA
jgi:Protein prenyltransferase alpha subunit repeat